MSLLDITIALDRDQVQSILIEDWPEEMPLPRLAVIDVHQAIVHPSTAQEANTLIGHTVEQCLPNAAQYLKSRGIEYIRLAYEHRHGRWHSRLFVPPKTEGRKPYLIRSDITKEITEFFFMLLRKRQPDCLAENGSSGVFRWLIDPEKLVHRHDARLAARAETFVYHDL